MVLFLVVIGLAPLLFIFCSFGLCFEVGFVISQVLGSWSAPFVLLLSHIREAYHILWGCQAVCCGVVVGCRCVPGGEGVALFKGVRSVGGVVVISRDGSGVKFRGNMGEWGWGLVVVVISALLPPYLEFFKGKRLYIL